MRRKLDLCLFMGVVWIFIAGRIQGEEIEHHLLSSAAQGHHEKIAGSFEHVHSLAMDAEGRSLFLGTHAGLFRSEDGGRSWQRVALSAKHAHLDVMVVTAHPKEPTTLYLGTHEAGVLKSTDGGRTWVEANTGLKGLDVHGLALDPNRPAKLHVAVREEGEGIYRTGDAGGRWVRVDDGPGSEVKVLASVNIPTGMGGIFLYAGTSEGLQHNPDCF
ncbi:MAG: WD40/YVTN/BNR-like repeat-containing protein [Candidatus Binatia bacterium]